MGVSAADLIGRIRAGDREALAAWLAGRGDELRAWLELRVGAAPGRGCDASEVLQDVALYVVQHVRDFRGGTEAQLLAWVRRLLCSRAIDHIRRQKRHAPAGLPPEYPSLDQVPAGQSSPSQRAMRNETEERLYRAADRLAPEQLLVVLLKEVDGCSLKEIARSLGRRPAETAALYYRGLEALPADVGAGDTLLRRALARLPARQRQAVELKHLEGWSLGEVAEYFPCTYEGVGSLLHRGMTALRAQLASAETRAAP